MKDLFIVLFFFLQNFLNLSQVSEILQRNSAADASPASSFPTWTRRCGSVGKQLLREVECVGGSSSNARGAPALVHGSTQPGRLLEAQLGHPGP